MSVFLIFTLSLLGVNTHGAAAFHVPPVVAAVVISMLLCCACKEEINPKKTNKVTVNRDMVSLILVDKVVSSIFLVIIF
jgi:hypothetical protein